MDVFGIVVDMCIITDDLAEVESVGPDVDESVEGDEDEEEDEDGHDDLGMDDDDDVDDDDDDDDDDDGHFTALPRHGRCPPRSRGRAARGSAAPCCSCPPVRSWSR